MVENNSTTFRCNICNKNYKDKSGLWYHNKKYHMYKLHQNPTILHQKVETSNINSTNLHQNTPIIHTHKYECEYCNNIFSRSDSLNRHYNRCKYKLKYNDQQSQDEIINLLKQAIDEQKKMFEQQIIEMKNQLLETINKKCKVHPKNTSKNL